MSGSVDWPTIGVMVGIGVLLWRALGARIDALGERVSALDTRLTAAVQDVDRRLTAAVGDVDRRLARLEGWIEGERAGRSRPPEDVPDDAS